MFWRSAAVLLAAYGAPAAAQRTSVTELGAGVVVTYARRDLAAAGVLLGYRPGGGQARAMLALAGGSLDGRAALRVEATAQFVLNPAAPTGVTVFGGAGVALVAASGTPGAAYVLLLVGVERAGARRWGWFTEAGLGGGARLAAGVKVRRRYAAPTGAARATTGRQ